MSSAEFAKRMIKIKGSLVRTYNSEEKKKTTKNNYFQHSIAIYGLRYAETCPRAYTDSEGPDQGASAQFEYDRCSLTESLHTIECINGKQMSR